MPSRLSNSRVTKKRADRNAIESAGMRLDSFLCAAGSQKRDGGTNQLLNEKFRLEEEKLKRSMSKFVDSQAETIIIDAMTNPFSGSMQSESLSVIRTLDPFVAAELLIALTEVEGGSRLLDAGFLKLISGIDAYISSALIYEIRITGNVQALTDRRLFDAEAVEFFSRLGPESASEWFNSIGKTGNINALTSKGALSDGVLNAIKENSNIASELSYAIGETGLVERLTSHGFLGFLNGLESGVASEYLSAIWCTRKPDEFTSAGMMERISSGEANVWKEAARLSNSYGSESPMKIVMSRPGNDGHDRGVKLIIQSLMDEGYIVLYTGSTAGYEEVVQTAISEGAHAIGFSLMGDSHKHMISNVASQMKIHGLGDVVMFGGGLMTQDQARSIERTTGIRLFSDSASHDDMINFLNSSKTRLHRAVTQNSKLGDAKAMPFSVAGSDASELLKMATVMPIFPALSTNVPIDGAQIQNILPYLRIGMRHTAQHANLANGQGATYGILAGDSPTSDTNPRVQQFSAAPNHVSADPAGIIKVQEAPNVMQSALASLRGIASPAHLVPRYSESVKVQYPSGYAGIRSGIIEKAMQIQASAGVSDIVYAASTTASGRMEVLSLHIAENNRTMAPARKENGPRTFLSGEAKKTTRNSYHVNLADAKSNAINLRNEDGLRTDTKEWQILAYNNASQIVPVKYKGSLPVYSLEDVYTPCIPSAQLLRELRKFEGKITTGNPNAPENFSTASVSIPKITAQYPELREQAGRLSLASVKDPILVIAGAAHNTMAAFKSEAVSKAPIFALIIGICAAGAVHLM